MWKILCHCTKYASIVSDFKVSLYRSNLACRKEEVAQSKGLTIPEPHSATIYQKYHRTKKCAASYRCIKVSLCISNQLMCIYFAFCAKMHVIFSELRIDLKKCFLSYPNHALQPCIKNIIVPKNMQLHRCNKVSLCISNEIACIYFLIFCQT